jgi:rod shape-determining protein MreC
VRDQGYIIWLVLGTVLLAILNLPESISNQVKAAFREAVAPLQSAVAGTARRVTESIGAVRGLGGALTDNQRMTAEIVRLRNEVRDLKALEAENIALREQLGFARRSPQALIPSEVIARDISGWWQTVRLDKGAGDGIQPDQAVVTTEGLVGRTIAVSPRTTDVLLLSDPSCRISAQIARSGSYGVVSGRRANVRGQVLCVMDFISKDAPVLVGDEVVTSGLGDVFPRGLLIGYVDQVVMDRSGLFQQAQVLPKADLGALRYVFVVAEQVDPVEDLLRKHGMPGVVPR